jgi:rhodanese-related sulfurtransferase
MIGILLVPFAIIPVRAEGLSYNLIDVTTAHTMITSSQYPDLLILDVRSTGEYKLSHLENSISIPFDQIDSRISELAGNESGEILVYCKSGFTSQLAAEILVIHGFTRVSSLNGGIMAWVEMDYPVWTASHYVSVGPGGSLNIEPLLSYLSATPAPPLNSSCGLQDFNSTTDFSSVIIEQDENHTVELVTIELNDTIFEATRTITRITELVETTEVMNRSIWFGSIRVNTSDSEFLVYTLSFFLEHTDYTLSLHTSLTPLDSNTFNNSVSVVLFKPVEDPEVRSFEAIEFTGPLTLSKIYTVIAKVAKTIGKEYDNSADDYLKMLGSRYAIIHDELKDLSEFVHEELMNYDRIVMAGYALLFDACDAECIEGAFLSCYGLISGFLLGCAVTATVACIFMGPAWAVCLAGTMPVCLGITLALAIACGVVAIIACCTGGGGGCPILTVFDGGDYVSEGLLDIHAEDDIVRTFFLETNPGLVENRYLMRLTEHPQTRSHLDEVRLYARVCDGWLVEIPLVSAVHVVEGDVLMQLSHSDDIRVDIFGADHNNGSSQYIDLEFIIQDGFTAFQLIIVLEGYNADTKD